MPLADVGFFRRGDVFPFSGPDPPRLLADTYRLATTSDVRLLRNYLAHLSGGAGFYTVTGRSAVAMLSASGSTFRQVQPATLI